MPKDIDETSGLTGGIYRKPLGTDAGDVSAEVIREFIGRMSVHTHEGKDSLTAILPRKMTEDFTFIAFSTIDSDGLYNADLVMTKVNSMPDANLVFLYADAGNTNWTEFFPSYDVINSNTVRVYTVRNDIDIRVVS